MSVQAVKDVEQGFVERFEAGAPPCLCFLHIQKTGGTSITKAFMPLFDQNRVICHAERAPARLEGLDFLAGHLSFNDIEGLAGGRIYMTCLRQPTQRLVSLYRFWRSVKCEKVFGADLGHIASAKSRSFSEFIMCDNSDLLEVTDNHLVRWLTPVNGPVTEELYSQACANLERFDIILLQETLKEDIEEIFTKLGARDFISIPEENVTDTNCLKNPDRFESAEAVEACSDPEFERILFERTHFDARLYDFAKTLRIRRSAARRPLPRLPLKLLRLPQGQRISSRGGDFARLLGPGWTPRFEDLFWTEEDRALLRFGVDWRSLCEGVVRLEIVPCMILGRRRLDMVLQVEGGERRSVVFLEDGLQMSAREIGGDVDDICIGDRSFIFDLALAKDCDAWGEYRVNFEIGPRVAPVSLGHNNDDRKLGVRLVSVQALSRSEASILRHGPW